MRPRLVPLLGALLLAIASVVPVAAQSPSPAVSPGSDPATAAAPVVEPCAKDIAQGFECITLSVPLDHFADTDRRTEVTFAIKRHT
ncbi:MAG: hypothetical protein LH650_01705, partial [Chloroflexi bacterium]|nr:hypothetical protein [Chloroflexota bacterium]